MTVDLKKNEKVPKIKRPRRPDKIMKISEDFALSGLFWPGPGVLGTGKIVILG